jgi:1,4-dihydroxy-2-naphthoate octaprenyltransferase
VSDEPPGAPPAPVRPPIGPAKKWILGARPRTLAAAAVPVVVGTACGWWLIPAGGPHWVAYAPLSHAVNVAPIDRRLIWWRAVAALVVALGVQVGTNYANDYSDGVRGTDNARVGPVRLVAGGLASPGAVRRAAFMAFGVAAVVGVALAAVTTWWLLLVGAVCFLAGWFYTGGPKPYGYLGLGELFVFVFFGVVATVGSSYVQHPWLGPVFHGPLPAALSALPALGPTRDWWLPFVAAVPVGLLATALLEANNLRDIAGDVVANKRTLAVRLGRRRAGWLYVGSLAGAAAGVAVVGIVRPWALLALAAAPLAVGPVRTVLSEAEGRELLPVLGGTGRIQLVVGVLLAVGIVL